MVNKNFGQLLRNFRNINQLTQQQVADVLNIHRTTYTYYENGITEPSIVIYTRKSFLSYIKNSLSVNLIFDLF